MNTEITKVCPKCKKDYSGNPYWKQSLKRHLSRKNPCNRKKDEKYVRVISEKPNTASTQTGYYKVTLYDMAPYDALM